MHGLTPSGERVSRFANLKLTLVESGYATDIRDGNGNSRWNPPADIDIYVVPDMLQTEISVTTTEMAGGSPPADIDICVIPDVLPTAMSVKTVMSDKSMKIDTPDGVVSRLEVAGGSPPAENDINGSPDVLQRAVSMTAVVSEKWMERFVMNLKVLCSDGLVPDENPARRSSDVGSDGCVVQDPIPTAVSVRTVVAEEWMDRFVLDLMECPSVSRTSAVARTLGPAMSEEYSPVVFAGGRLPMLTARVSGLQLVKSDTA